MKFLLKMILFVVLAPFILIVLLLAVIAAAVGLPLLWQEAVKRFTAPPGNAEGSS